MLCLISLWTAEEVTGLGYTGLVPITDLNGDKDDHTDVNV